MVSLYATVVGIVSIVGLVLAGLWLTWLSLQDDRHKPAPLRPDEADESE